ncbi:hypothetical protein MY11210_002798 [Beauveria gryllotalpidicola]
MHDSNSRVSRSCLFCPPPIKKQRKASSKPSLSTSSRSRSRGSGTDSDTDVDTDYDESWFSTSAPDGFIDLEAGCGTWPDHPRNVPLWRRARAKMFRSKVKSKIEYPEDCSEIGYQVYRGAPLLKLGVWITVFFFYALAIRNVAPRLGLVSDSQATESGGGYDMLDCIMAWTGAIVAAAAAFLVGQGYFGECLALLTAYPVALLHQIRGNTCEPAVTKYCQQVAYNLKKLHDGAIIIVRSPHATRQAMAGHRSGPKQPVRVEYFFELFSLHLESEFSQQRRKSAVPSMVPQHVIYQLHNHFENIVDNHCLDHGRAAFVRESIEILAFGGRECTVYASCDVIPNCTLWTVDICCRLIALSVPIRRCSWLVKPVGMDLIVRMALLVVMPAAAMLILAEMWSLWNPFGKGLNTFSWTLGIASEIDNMLNEFYESETKVPVREHKFMDL